MKKLLIVSLALLIGAAALHAQAVDDFGKISLDSGYFVYHGLKFEKIWFMSNQTQRNLDSDFLIISSGDATDVSYVDTQLGTVMVIKKKNGWVGEMPVKFITFIEYSDHDKVIKIH